MFELQKINTGNLIDIIGIMLTLLAIVLSVWQFAKSINHSILEAKQQMAIEQTSELPIQVAEFCSYASNVAVGVWIGQSNMDSGLKIEFEESKKKQDELLIVIRNSILAYGSIDAIKIFTYFEKNIANSSNGENGIEVYYLLPLLLAQVKMDVTGVSVNSIVLFNSLMPQFKDYNDKAKVYINKIIDELKLDSSLKIN